MVQQFLTDHPNQVAKACFDVAGPVVEGRARITNLPWTMDEHGLQQALGLKTVRLLNDLEALARAVPRLQPDETAALNQGAAEQAGAIAVIAPGTGLGEAFLTWHDGAYEAHSSEGGHADFAPADAEQDRLLEYLQGRLGHVSWERVCSGVGLPNIYDFLRGEDGAADATAGAASAHPQDRTHSIIDAALNGRPVDATCLRAVEMFAAILAAAAGNLALTVWATGGVYLGGGIPSHVLPVLQAPSFMQRFTSKGRSATSWSACRCT